jgi:hypothetical protein
MVEFFVIHPSTPERVFAVLSENYWITSSGDENVSPKRRFFEPNKPGSRTNAALLKQMPLRTLVLLDLRVPAKTHLANWRH